MRRVAWSGFALVLWGAWAVPFTHVRPTFRALAAHVGAPSGRHLCAVCIRAATRGADRVDRVRHGYAAEVDGTLAIPEEARLKALLSDGGLFLALPHAHAALAMGRALAQRYPVTAIVRVSADTGRATAQHRLYARMGAEIVDARNESAQAVARKALRALRSDRIVVAMADRIATAPDEATDRRRDLVRVTAFGQPLGIGGWPVRFAAKARVPIPPAIVARRGDGMDLVLGRNIPPGGDVAATAQSITSALEDLIRAHPEEWVFCLDKHWSRALRAGPPG